MTVHFFDSTGDAYDATQCREDIKRGDVLVIISEEVVGIADTWPVAVTVAHGNLHTTTGRVDCYFDFDVSPAFAAAKALGYPVRR